jgi:hypothetical protein
LVIGLKIPVWRYKLDENDEVEIKSHLWQLVTVPDSTQISRGTYKTLLLGGVYKRPIRENSSWSAGLGGYSIDENVTVSLATPIARNQNQNGVTANLRYLFNQEDGYFSAQAAREINPSGQNTILLTNRAGISWSKGLTPYQPATTKITLLQGRQQPIVNIFAWEPL